MQAYSTLRPLNIILWPRKTWTCSLNTSLISRALRRPTVAFRPHSNLGKGGADGCVIILRPPAQRRAGGWRSPSLARPPPPRFRALVPPWNPTRMKPSAVSALPSRPSRATSPTERSASWRRRRGCTRRRELAVSVRRR